MKDRNSLQAEIERLRTQNRRLHAEVVQLRDRAEHERERLAYLIHEVAELRRGIPDTFPQAAAPGSERREASGDPLVRLFKAIRSAR